MDGHYVIWYDALAYVILHEVLLPLLDVGPIASFRRIFRLLELRVAGFGHVVRKILVAHIEVVQAYQTGWREIGVLDFHFLLSHWLLRRYLS